MSPKSMWCNGHLLLDSRKMSKSTGNFLTLQTAIDRWGADVVRMTFANAGDSTDDANFECIQADKLVIRLAKEIEWNATMIKQKSLRDGPLNLFDEWYVNTINLTAKQVLEDYENMTYRNVMQHAWFGLLKARDTYRLLVNNVMHRQCITSHIEFQTQYLCPIMPHSCEHLWSKVLMRDGSVLTSKLMMPAAVDSGKMREAEYLQNVIRMISRKHKPGKGITILVASSPRAWMVSVLDFILKRHVDEESIVRNIADTEHWTLKESKVQVLPLYKHLTNQHEPRFLDERRIVSTHIDLIAAATGILVQHLSIETSDTISLEKPRCKLMNADN